MTIRSRFRLATATPMPGAGSHARMLRFVAEADPQQHAPQEGGENRQQSQYAAFHHPHTVPTGTLEVLADNEHALNNFELGKSYYLHFEPVNDAHSQGVAERQRRDDEERDRRKAFERDQRAQRQSGLASGTLTGGADQGGEPGTAKRPASEAGHGESGGSAPNTETDADRARKSQQQQAGVDL